MTFHLQEECQLLQQDIDNYSIANDHDVRSMDQPSIIDLLDSKFYMMCNVIVALLRTFV